MSKITGFRAQTLEEERTDEKRTKVTVSLNDSVEMPRLRRMKELLDIPSDSTALKIVFEIGANVLQTTFSEETLKKVISRDRVRNADYKRAKNTRI